jgi:hypothetical protein
MPRHTTVVAYLALLIALGGSSYAAVQIARNSVRSKHIANGQVKRADLAPKARAGRTGEPGPRGEAGPPGPKGEPGPPTTNADTLDGIDSSEFFRGRVTRTTATLSAGSNTFTAGRDLDVPGLGRLSVTCPEDPESEPGFISYVNTAGGSQLSFVDDGNPPPAQKELALDEDHTVFSYPSAHVVRFTIARPDAAVATITVARGVQPSVINPSAYRCRVQAQAIVSG